MKNLNHKQKALLYTIDKLHERALSSRSIILNTLFLLENLENIGKLIRFYNFFPSDQGPFSHVLFHDISLLQKEGYLDEEEIELKLTEKGKAILKGTNPKVTLRINRFLEKFNPEKEITGNMQQKLPDSTIQSKLFSSPEENKIESGLKPGLFTTGYEGRDIDLFLGVLIRNSIDIVIDVRANPFSMKPDFSKDSLKSYLENSGIHYLHMPELGVKSEKRKNLATRNDFIKLSQDYEKTLIEENSRLLDRIAALSRNHRVALMCFEADVNACHRGIIARHIRSRENIEIVNI